MSKKDLRTCEKGHEYYKSSDCLTCPTCEALKRPKDGFLSLLNAPARRALESIGVKTIWQLSQQKQKDIMALHGMGPASLPKLMAALRSEGLSFKTKQPKKLF
jgi:hypothetical protein